MPNSQPKRPPGRPRKPAGEKATEYITIRLTPAEAAELRRRGVVAWLRPLLRNEARP